MRNRNDFAFSGKEPLDFAKSGNVYFRFNNASQLSLVALRPHRIAVGVVSSEITVGEIARAANIFGQASTLAWVPEPAGARPPNSNRHISFSLLVLPFAQ